MYSTKLNITKQLWRELNTIGLILLEKANELDTISESKLKRGDIDAFQYIVLMNSSLQNKLNYLELLHQYNQSVIELEYLTLK